MPRDLFSTPSETTDGITLTKSPEMQTPPPESVINRPGQAEFSIYQNSSEQSPDNRKQSELARYMHPYVQTLSLSNVESCVALENAVFPEHERCSREKFIYRLSTCPELCLGLFSTSDSKDSLASAGTYDAALPTDSFTPARKSVLLAHVIATKCESVTVTDDSMDLPPDWQGGIGPSESRGHQENGRTIAVHSLAVLPAYQGMGLGKTVMKAYLQRMESSGIGNRCALLAHDPMVLFYKPLGFIDTGESKCNFGGGGWNDMASLYTSFPQTNWWTLKIIILCLNLVDMSHDHAEVGGGFFALG